MKLLRIEACGFKSFADPVSFEIGQGVTAFVGPNGCGKSNIVDAIKWALGEQSAKSLRGKEMLDVIFNGSQGRGPAGMAEVTLVFDNAEGKLRIPQAEVAVTRRLLRSGESEYRVNREPCRLRDIRELFWDTGVGVEAYSVIEQGRVDLLLHASARERREIFEEAAGISRYRAKVHLATAKLERVDANLLRIRDLVKELDRQLKSIRRQAARARRAKEIQEEYRSLRLKVHLHRYADLARQAEALRREEEALSQALRAAGARLEEMERRGEAADSERSTLERSVQEVQFELSRIERDAQALEEQGRISAARAGQIGREAERMAGQVRGAREARERAAVQAAGIAPRMEALGAQARQSEDVLRRKEEESKSVEEQVARALDRRERRQEEEMERLRLRVRREGERLALEREREGLLARSARLIEKADTLTPTAGHGREQEAAAVALFEALSAERGKLAVKEAYYREEAERFLAQEESERGQIETLRYRLGRAESRQAAARDGDRQARAICSQRSLGRLLDFMKAPAACAHAVESALGRHGADWIVEDLDGALEIVDGADGKRLPGLGVFPLARALVRGSGQARSFSPEEGIVGWAGDLVECQENVRPVIQALLSDALVVEDRAAALAAQERYPRARMVTLSGEIHEPSGAIQYVGEEEGLGTTALHFTAARLEKEVLRLSSGIEQAEAHRSAVRARREEALAVCRRAQEEGAALDGRILSARSELERVRAAATQLERELDLARGEAQAARREADEILARMEAPEAADPEGPAGGGAGDGSEEALQAQWKTCQEGLSGARSASQEARRALEGEAAALKGLREEEARWEAEAKRLADTAQALSDQAACDQEEAAKAQDRARATRQTQPALAARLAEARGALAKFEEENAQRRRELAEARGGERRAEAALSEKQMAAREVQLRLSGEADRAREDLHEELSERIVSYADEPADWEALAARCEELKRELERTGGVDLEALSEEEELERRHSFLRTQEEDLTRAREALADLIRGTNKVSREMFQETFQKIRVNFQEAFRKLFGGGKADILLEEGADLLEAGIEIVARPPGKEPRFISLLSGGEKSMTAVALLFAVFQSRPSPFCILDEADAALDERNIDRFVGIVKEFLAHSQFLIITHNKRTMRVADRLYGVTQQEPGVSIPLPLKFEEIEGN